MSAPLASQGLFGGGTELAIALGLGLCFGFFLERAGFGSSRKLAAQFYLYDMAVLKVMFTRHRHRDDRPVAARRGRLARSRRDLPGADVRRCRSSSAGWCSGPGS